MADNINNVKNSIKGGVDDAATGVKNIVDRGANTVKREGGTMDSAKDTLHTVVEKAGEYAHDARKKVGDWAGQVGEKAQKAAEDVYEVATDKAGDFGREVTDLVRRHPLPAIMIGFGLGLLLGRAARIV